MTTGTLLIIALTGFLILLVYGEISLSWKRIDREAEEKKALRPGMPHVSPDGNILIACSRAWTAFFEKSALICRKDPALEAAAPAMERLVRTMALYDQGGDLIDVPAEVFLGAGESIRAMSETIEVGYIVDHYDEAVGDGVKGYAEYLCCLDALAKDLKRISKFN